MGTELRTLLWLQWKLLGSFFRTRSTSDSLRAVTTLSRAMMLVLLLPLFALMGVGLAVALILLSPAAAYELAMLVNVFLFLLWLVVPASYSSQLFERFEMSRLFPHPIRFSTVIVGSTLISMLSMTGVWTIPIMLGQIVGLAWHRPLATPAIVVGAVPVFVLLALTGRIMEDLFDLVSGDRRLRALALALLTLPFTLCWLGQLAVQRLSEDYQQLPTLLQTPVVEELAQLEDPDSLAELVDVSGQALEILGLSRWLIWLPPGWATSGMALPALGDFWRGVLAIAGSLAFIGILLGGHAWITRRLMDGATLRVGAERVRRRRVRWQVPGPPAFVALLSKDWRYLWRSPIPRRFVFSSLVMAFAMALPLYDVAEGVRAVEIARALPLIAFAFETVMVGMGINMVMTANYFGTFDREGFVTLALSPVDRRYVLLSANLAVVVYAMAQNLFLVVVIAILTRSWVVVPLGLYLGLCLQVSSTPVCTLSAILAPYRTRLRFSRGRESARLWGMLTWLIAAPPVLAMIVLPYVFWRPGLIFTLPLAAAYSGALYVLTLKPLSRLLQRREHAVWTGVTAHD